MSSYEAIRHPQLDGSVFAPSLGLHVHVGMRGRKLARVGISHDPHEGAPDEAAAPLLARIAAHCATGRDDFRDIELDLTGVSDFGRMVLTTLVREVGPGNVCSYGDLARMVGKRQESASSGKGPPAGGRAPEDQPRRSAGASSGKGPPAGGRAPEDKPRRSAAARAIGGAMARNPIPIVIPCHRVLPAGNRIGNYSGEGGWETKMALLRIEGAKGAWQQSTL